MATPRDADDVRQHDRWTSSGDQWHTHAFTHAHPGAEQTGQDHAHLFTTDEDTRAPAAAARARTTWAVDPRVPA